MTFTSYTYLLFLAVAVVIVRLTRGHIREFVLVTGSLIFYAAWDPRFLVVLLGLAIFTYLAGHAVARRRGGLAAVLWSVAAIVFLLSLFKYTEMCVQLVNIALPARLRLPIPSIVLPLGISFYTFECISYLLDIHKGTRELMPFRRFILFPAFWPHMVAGPILRIKEFAPQLETLRPARADEILAGVDRVLIGVSKKVVIANALAGFVDQGFAGGARANSALDNWVLALAFGLQIYFDFSAYTDIAIGSARMLGFTFPENFNLPYHATSPTDFWNRWHMTLSRWVRDYVFFPLNLKAGRRIWLRYLMLVGVMGIVGLWHGPGLTFIAWGIWHGLLMAGHRLLQTSDAALPPWAQRVASLLGQAITLVLVNAAWVLFRSPTVEQAGRMLRGMFSLHGLRPAYSVNDYLLVLLCVAEYIVLEPVFKRLFERDSLRVDYSGWTFWLRPLAYAVGLTLIFMFDESNVAFIYFQF
jgi:alginate O-acetyltransferase complex protein AlgI